MKKIIILTVMLSVLNATAQQNVDPSAALEVASTTKGFLPPRMISVQMLAINNPAAGLIVYNLSDYKMYDLCYI